MTAQLTPINWHPFAANPLDYIGNDNLRTPDGKKVTITKGSTFLIYFDGVMVYDAGIDNSAACAFLHYNDVGIGR